MQYSNFIFIFILQSSIHENTLRSVKFDIGLLLYWFSISRQPLNYKQTAQKGKVTQRNFTQHTTAMGKV